MRFNDFFCFFLTVLCTHVIHTKARKGMGRPVFYYNRKNRNGWHGTSAAINEFLIRTTNPSNKTIFLSNTTPCTIVRKMNILVDKVNLL